MINPVVLLAVATSAAAWSTHQQYACSNADKPLFSNGTVGSDAACQGLCGSTPECAQWQLHRASGTCWGYATKAVLQQNNDFDCGCAGECTVKPITRDPGFAKPDDAPLVLLPQDKGDASPAALDGSPYGLYFSPSTTNSTKWTISIDGGGWCYDEVLCLSRSKGGLGSSKNLPKTNWCLCSNVNDAGDDYEHDCNCLRLPYLDGASFSGYRAKPWPVPGTNETVTFRGIKNFDAALDFAFAHGMTGATEFVLSGGSAGGLSTFLHADRAAARVVQGAPRCKKVRAAPIVGYFLDHDNFAHSTGYPGGPNTPQWSTPGTAANYTMWMKYVHGMQNLSFGGDGGLTAACQTKHADAPHLCFMSPHMQDVINTPFFMFNSKYDSWQLGNEFQSKWATQAEQDGVRQYGKDFLAQLKPVYAAGAGGAGTKNGGFITSCICHGCPWSDLALDGKNAEQHYIDWMVGRTTGSASMHIDPRLPNGGGALNGTTFQMCSAFP